MDGIRRQLLRGLDPQEFHTGTELGRALGVSRAAVHKHVRALAALGVPIHSVPGRGYRLAEGATLLDAHAIETGLTLAAGSVVTLLEVLDEVDSTSAHLSRDSAARLHGRVCLAEKQSAGRGRRGRAWVASPYRDVTMSIGIEYQQWPADLPALGLVTALAIVDGLAEIGIEGLAVKWPNDIVRGPRKLCGVLLDVSGEAHGLCRVIVGVGLNVKVDEERARGIDRQWIDLETITGRSLDRNVLVAQCLNKLLPVLEAFPREGLAGHLEAWRRLDSLSGRLVTVHTVDGRTMTGTAAGVDPAGRLRLEDDSGAVHWLTQGDVSVRVR